MKLSSEISRKFYRIDPQKLVKYHSNLKIHQQRSISTQTIFNKRVQLSKKSLLFSQTSDIDIDYSSSTIESQQETDFPNDSYPKFSFKRNSNENDEYDFSDNISKSQSINSRMYIRSIYRYMFANEISN